MITIEKKKKNGLYNVFLYDGNKMLDVAIDEASNIYFDITDNTDSRVKYFEISKEDYDVYTIFLTTFNILKSHLNLNKDSINSNDLSLLSNYKVFSEINLLGIKKLENSIIIQFVTKNNFIDNYSIRFDKGGFLNKLFMSMFDELSKINPKFYQITIDEILDKPKTKQLKASAR